MPGKSLKLEFHKLAWKEYRSLDAAIRNQFKKKLIKLCKRQESPPPSHAISGMPSGYFKIKLKRSGFRLVYKYQEAKLVVYVISVGKRDRNIVYEVARSRLKQPTK